MIEPLYQTPQQAVESKITSRGPPSQGAQNSRWQLCTHNPPGEQVDRENTSGRGRGRGEQTTTEHAHGYHGEDEGQPTQQGARVEKARARSSGLQVRQDVGGQRGEKAAF